MTLHDSHHIIKERIVMFIFHRSSLHIIVKIYLRSFIFISLENKFSPASMMKSDDENS